jgi:hypothetical protein
MQRHSVIDHIAGEIEITAIGGLRQPPERKSRWPLEQAWPC